METEDTKKRLRYPKSLRLTSSKKLSEIRFSGRKIGGEKFVIYFRSSAPCKLFGTVVSRKIKGSVKRNRLKRLMREFFRLNQHRIREGTQVLCIATEKALSITGYAEISQNILDLLKKAQLVV